MSLFSVIQEAYGIEPVKGMTKLRNHVLILTCVNGDEYVVKIGKDPVKLPYEHELQTYLAKQGLPVQKLIRTTSDWYAIEYEEKSHVLYSYIDGFSVEDEYAEENREYIRLYGRSLGRLHQALEGASLEHGSRHNIFKTLDIWVRNILADTTEDLKMHQLLDVITDYFRGPGEDLPRQYIHRDPHAGNILLTKEDLAGFIDFELSYHCVRIFDPCYLCTGFLQEAFNRWYEKERWFDLVREVFAGYRSVISMTEEELHGAVQVMLAIQMIFVADCTEKQLRKPAQQNMDMLKFIVQHSNQVDKAVRGIIENKKNGE